MKKLVLLLVLSASTSAFAADGNLAAEMYVRTIAKSSAAAAGNVGALCRNFASTLNVNLMGKKITDDQGAWTHASEADKTEFKKSFLKFLVDNVIEHLTSNTHVTDASVSSAGSGYVVKAKIQSDTERSVSYSLSVRQDVLATISDAELQALKSSGSNAATEAKLKRAFVIYDFVARQTQIIDVLRSNYAQYANHSGRPGVLYPDFFRDTEKTQGTCP